MPTQPHHTARRRIGLALSSMALATSGVVVTSGPASANVWSTCMAPYQKAWNATSGTLSDAIFHVGMSNCSARTAQYFDARDNFAMYDHYYRLHRTHYPLAAKKVAAVGVRVWQTLSRFGIRSGLARL